MRLGKLMGQSLNSPSVLAIHIMGSEYGLRNLVLPLVGCSFKARGKGISTHFRRLARRVEYLV